MLALPTSGFSRPAGTSPEIVHNIRLDILCDWIEGSVLFDDEVVSKIDLVEILIEGNIYNDSNLALNIVNEAWSELKRRFGCIKEGNPFSFIRQNDKKQISMARKYRSQFLPPSLNAAMLQGLVNRNFQE